MKKHYTYAVLILMLVCSCKDPRPAPVQQQPVPEALQQNSSDYPLISKSRSDGNLVDELYNELAEKTPALRTLEQSIGKLTAGKTDSAATFQFFDQKNNSFYSAAGSYASRITDSALKLQLKNLLDNSMAGYKNKTAAHNSLLHAIDKKNITLSDLHIILKLVKTMAVMEQYQAANQPSVQPLQSVLAEYEKLIAATKALSSH